ncbi:MAG: helix-turn-helix domain-containing protein [Desulfosarcina sp.]|nr:helix-turn-helix domain-containing protein [Desulfosarcina sp.]MBC2744148.1 helix-turn-helix domain-containing protein [Desulfosarcina sp.]MBC2767057.1 helix-turn-helix domain-containing protein [Desulfosarcina sp.]
MSSDIHSEGSAVDRKSEQIAHLLHPEPPPQLLNIDQMAEVLNVPKSWLYGKTRETGPEAIPRLKLGKYLRFEPVVVLEWIRRQTAAGMG